MVDQLPTEVASRQSPPRGRTGARLLANPWYAQLIIYVLLALGAAITVIPMLVVLARSLSPPHIINQYPFLVVPKEVTLEAYKYITQTATLFRSFGITVYITVLGTFLNLLFTLTAAYGLSKTKIPGNRFFMTFIVFAMLFHAGLIPTYMVVRNLGLIDSLWALMLPLLVNPFNLILMRNFMWGIPESLEDSAHMDGAGVFTVLWHIIIPMSAPAIATIGLFYAVHHWNDFFLPLFYINNNQKWPLQLLLRSILIESAYQGFGFADEQTRKAITDENIKAATIIFVTIPILLVYPFIQKYFVKGIVIGAVKG